MSSVTIPANDLSLIDDLDGLAYSELKLDGTQRIHRLVLNLGVVEVINGFVLGAIGLGLYFFSGSSPLAFTLIINTFFHLVFYGLSTWLAWTKRTTAARIALLATTIVQLLILNFIAVFTGGTQSMLVWQILLAGLLFDRLWALIMGVFTAVTVVINVLVMVVWHPYTPIIVIDGDALSFAMVICLLVAVMLTTAGTVLVITNLQQALVYSGRGRKLLENTNRQLSLQQEHIEQLSERLAIISAQLAAASSQQASGTVEQLQTITEITSSMEQLAKVSTLISGSSVTIAKETHSTLEIAAAAEQNTEKAQDIAEKGLAATDQTIQAIHQVYDECTVIAEQLTNLTGMNEHIRSIVELINNVATEIHLLALNAAIESAGAGEYGSRFGVVADEVKQLAHRTRSSAEEVKRAVAEIIVEIGKAAKAAQSGLEESGKTIKLAEETEVIINQLAEVVEKSAAESRRIADAAHQNQQLAEEIHIATRQQLSGSEQIVLALREVNQVSLAVSSSAKQVSGSTFEIKELVSNLREVLADS